MDFILEMHAKDRPDELTFKRGGDEPPPPARDALIERRLFGRAKAMFYAKRIKLTGAAAKAVAGSTPAAIREKLAGRGSRDG